MLDDFFHIMCCVNVGDRVIGPLSGELWESEALVGEGRVIHQMPVQHAELTVRHGVQCVQDDRQRQVMARCIQQQAPVREAGVVLNFGLVDKERALSRSPNKLAKSLQTSESTPDTLRLE
jgi:hypothetical protein